MTNLQAEEQIGWKAEKELLNRGKSEEERFKKMINKKQSEGNQAGYGQRYTNWTV